jgi:hypothetical protein
MGLELSWCPRRGPAVLFGPETELVERCLGPHSPRSASKRRSTGTQVDQTVYPGDHTTQRTRWAGRSSQQQARSNRINSPPCHTTCCRCTPGVRSQHPRSAAATPATSSSDTRDQHSDTRDQQQRHPRPATPPAPGSYRRQQVCKTAASVTANWSNNSRHQFWHQGSAAGAAVCVPLAARRSSAQDRWGASSKEAECRPSHVSLLAASKHVHCLLPAACRRGRLWLRQR